MPLIDLTLMTHAASDTTVFPLVSTYHFKSSFWSAILAFDFPPSLAISGYDISSHGTAGPSVKRGSTPEFYLFHLRVSFGEPLFMFRLGRTFLSSMFRLLVLHPHSSCFASVKLVGQFLL